MKKHLDLARLADGFLLVSFWDLGDFRIFRIQAQRKVGKSGSPIPAGIPTKGGPPGHGPPLVGRRPLC